MDDISFKENKYEFTNSLQNDLLFTGTTTKWLRCENCIIQRGTIEPKGGFIQYSPFEKYPEILIDFLKLANKIDKLNSGMCEFLGMQRQSSKAKKKIKSFEKDLLEEYRKFTLDYGILGIGISRILDVSRRTFDKVTGVTTFSVNIKSILIKQKPDLDDPLYPYYDVSLPQSGGEVSIEEWNKAYGGVTWKHYKETLTQLMDCDLIREIIEDMKAEKQGNIKDYRFKPDGVCVTFKDGGQGFSWEFSSLIQAISIMYGSNKAHKFTPRVLQCPTCGIIFKTEDKLRKYCDSNCKETMLKRKYRKKQLKESE